MLVIGLDISATNTGVAEGEPGGKPRLYSVKFGSEGATADDMGVRALRWIVERLKAENALIAAGDVRIAIETEIPNFAFGGATNHHTTDVLIGLNRVIACAAMVKGVPVARHTCGAVRKFFIGKGNHPTKVAKRLVRKRCEQLGWSASNNDESDAAAVWAFECSRLGALPLMGAAA
jgi:hypothetical protein